MEENIELELKQLEKLEKSKKYHNKKSKKLLAEIKKGEERLSYFQKKIAILILNMESKEEIREKLSIIIEELKSEKQ
jgi:hypothetical protein